MPCNRLRRWVNIIIIGIVLKIKNTNNKKNDTLISILFLYLILAGTSAMSISGKLENMTERKA